MNRLSVLLVSYVTCLELIHDTIFYPLEANPSVICLSSCEAIIYNGHLRYPVRYHQVITAAQLSLLNTVSLLNIMSMSLHGMLTSR